MQEVGLKDRVMGKNGWITTVIGIPIIFYGFFLLGGDLYHHLWKCCPELDASAGEIMSMIGLGYAFIVAKDSLIEGITLGLFKKK